MNSGKTFIDFILAVARRFYSGCRQTILFTWRGGMGVDRVHDVLDVSASCTMFLTSVDHVHDGHDVFDVS